MPNDETIYELSFHLNPDLEEKQVQQLAQNIENYVTSAGGVVSFKKEPERTRLSYPIKHKRQAYFGYIHFNLESKEKLENIDEQIKLNSDVLRYLVVKVAADSGKVKFRFKPQKPKVAPEKPVETKTPEETKDLEKQLEDIIGKL
jgi:ribosomal protein S6